MSNLTKTAICVLIVIVLAFLCVWASLPADELPEDAPAAANSESEDPATP